MSTTANSTFVACNSFNRKTYLFCFGLIMLASTVSALVIFLYVHFHVAIGHKGHDHSSLVAPTFGQHQVTPDVIDVAPTKELIVRMHLIFFFFFKIIAFIHLIGRLNTVMMWTCIMVIRWRRPKWKMCRPPLNGQRNRIVFTHWLWPVREIFVYFKICFQ